MNYIKILTLLFVMTLLQACDKAPTEATDKGSAAQESASTAPASAKPAQAPAIQEKPLKLSDAYSGKVYSPYAKPSIPLRPLWGDSHLHPSLSLDAGLFGNRLPPKEAYRFARGEEVIASTGQAVRLSRPLDWLMVADHSDGIGFFGDIAAGKPELMKYEQAARWNKAMKAGGDAAVKATLNLITTFAQGKMDPEMFAMYSPGAATFKNLWEGVIADAETYNEPGRFTAFIGFEWTSFVGYEKGVSMGGDLRAKPADAKAPNFMIIAMRDPVGANLDRIQIVKGGLDKSGKTHEKVYDVVWSGDRKPGSNGKLPPVGNTVDVKSATWSNTIGAADLATVWTDPDFDANQKAFYYARVLEIPTPRWTTYDAFRFGVEIPKGAPTSTQDRAYTSPIWYTPEK